MLTPSSNPLRGLLDRAERSLVGGDFAACAHLAEEALAKDAVNVPAHLLRGVASNQLGELDRAVTDLLFVLERQPGHLQASFHLGQALRKQRRYDAALARLKPTLDDRALRPHALFEVARCQRGLGHFHKAIEHYRQLLREVPGHADAAANLAALLEKTSQLEDAMTWAERATVLAPANLSARLTQALVQRRLGRFGEAARAFEELLQRNLPPMSRVIATNQLGQCLDRLGRFDEAYARFSEANRLQRDSDPEAGVDDHASYGIEVVRYIREWLRQHPVDGWSPTPPDDRSAPVFLVGFPRSGTTLLDQVLSAHPAIEVIEEQELFLEVRRRWVFVEAFHELGDWSETDIVAARRAYRNALAAARQGPDARVVVDKLPLNSVYLPLIHRLFPDARIIFALRDPRDACLSCFFQTFSLVGAMPYFLELDSTARFYDAVMGLAADAREALPLNDITVRYEDVVTDLEGQARRLVDFLGLPWNEAVLDYRKGQHRRDIGTPSYQQVSEPIYQRSAGRWKHYEKQLAGVEPILGPWVQRLGYEDDTGAS